MNRLQAERPALAIRPNAWINAALAVGAAALIPWVAMAFEPEDIEAIESPLLLSVVHQIESGPRELYGPFDGHYPLVLIHAPLYYRLAALTGWLFYRAGIDSVTAAQAAGRLLSALGFLSTLAATYGLARLGGLPVRAGGWAALLVAGTPVYGGIFFEVRPDMLGIAFQTAGILLMLRALGPARTGTVSVNAAAVCFAIAMCIKQQYLVAPLVSVALMAGVWARGRLGLTSVLRFLAIASALPLLYYGVEEWITSGRMSACVFTAARSVGKVHPADWSFAANLVLALTWKCVGLILLVAGAGLAAASHLNRAVRRVVVIAGTTMVGVIVTLVAVQFFTPRIGISALVTVGLIVVIAAVIPACATFERSLLGGWLDGALWAYFASEIVFTTFLWRLSTGGWFNYAIPAVVIACALTGRVMARVCDDDASWRQLVPIVLAALSVPLFSWTDMNRVFARRTAEQAATRGLVRLIARPAAEIFFFDLPGANRLHGRMDLVYDPWLYPVFESIGLAEPRSIWLERALATGPVRVIVTTSSRVEIDGLTQTLADLGYTLFRRVGTNFVWSRRVPTTE